jgi:hypothetical protein
VIVTLQSALRAFLNPDGVKSEQLDGYSYVAFDGTLPGVYITDAEKVMLRGRSNVCTQRFDRPGLLETADRTEFVDVVGSDEPMPWSVLP